MSLQQAFAPPPLTAHSTFTPRRTKQPAPSRRPTHTQRCAPSMLRVRDKRRPDDWEKITSTLSGRFLPMDPRDEAILDILERPAREFSLDEGAENGPPAHILGDTRSGGAPRKWSKRAEAARKRWADPVYRAKMLEKRAEKRRRDAEAAGEQHQPRVEIGVMDSITLCDDDKAQQINKYARSNKIRSEKITAFHRNRRVWMEERLKDTPGKLSDDEYADQKKALKEKRRQAAFKRVRNMKMKEELINSERLHAIEHVSNPMLNFAEDSIVFDE